MSTEEPYLLPEHPLVAEATRSRVMRDYEQFAQAGLPASIEDYLLQTYDLDVAASYGGVPISNPFGKASGQLSMTASQVADDVRAGLGFVVLKTVIACDSGGSRSMDAWAIKESRMVAEPIVGARGERGWTVSWKGRGWWQSFESYLQLVRDARSIAAERSTLIVPSCKYHLPTEEDPTWNLSEYEYTTQQLVAAWTHGAADDSDFKMPLEKDFSPTLAGSDRAAARSRILDWLRRTPELIRNSVAPRNAEPGQPRPAVRVGLKIFNALFDDAFQLEMLRALHQAPKVSRPDFFIYGNRLFDPEREFEGYRGIAYGGPDLSDRNLRVMAALQREQAIDEPSARLPWSATGNIGTGKMALEYALRGAESFQLHTFFQLPSNQYAMRDGSKTQKALHELYFHPENGFVIWMKHLAEQFATAGRAVSFLDVARGTLS